MQSSSSCEGNEETTERLTGPSLTGVGEGSLGSYSRGVSGGTVDGIAVASGVRSQAKGLYAEQLEAKVMSPCRQDIVCLHLFLCIS